MTRGVLVIAGIIALSGCVQNEDSGRALSLRLLTAGESLDKPVQASEFAPHPGARPGSSRFSGRLRLHTGDKVDHFLLLYDELGGDEADSHENPFGDRKVRNAVAEHVIHKMVDEVRA